MCYEIALAGNPNVGKSTIFNALTGLRQHTGNWTGKTVALSKGYFEFNGRHFSVTDLPGTYSMKSFSQEETVSQRYLEKETPACVVIVADSNVIERNLSYVLEVLRVCPRAVLCLNMNDEAKRKGIVIHTRRLSAMLGIPVLKTCAVRKKGLAELKKTVLGVCEGTIPCRQNLLTDDNPRDDTPNALLLSRQCREICGKCVTYRTDVGKAGKADRILTAKATGIPIMLALFGLLFWLTTVGANYPSAWLSAGFTRLGEWLYAGLSAIHAPDAVVGLLVDGVYATLTWVVSVMLPPMAIFFPLFSMLEDSGYLPRIAFNLDKFFSRCGAHGKQSLTMRMGFPRVENRRF